MLKSISLCNKVLSYVSLRFEFDLLGAELLVRSLLMKGSEGFPRAVFSIRGLTGLFCINRYAKEVAFRCLFMASNLTTTGAVILVRSVPMKSTKRLPRDVVILIFCSTCLPW